MAFKAAEMVRKWFEVCNIGEAHAGELHRWPVSQPRVASIFDLKSLAIQIVDNLNAFLNCARGRGFLVSKMMCAVVT